MSPSELEKLARRLRGVLAHCDLAGRPVVADVARELEDLARRLSREVPR